MNHSQKRGQSKKKSFSKANMDNLTKMYDVPFENMLEVGNFSDNDLYNLINTNKTNRNRILNYLKRTKNKKMLNKVMLYVIHASEENDELKAIDDVKLMKLLLDNGANVNYQDDDDDYDYTPLISASEVGAKNIAKLLIEKGANVNHKTTDGTTALMAASMEEYPEIVKLLLKNGANIKLKNDQGKTALGIIANDVDIRKKSEIAKILLGCN